MKNEFMVTLRDEKLDFILDEQGNVQYHFKQFTMQEVIELIDKAVRIKKSRYGFNVFSNGESVYLRFGNVTVKSKDNAEGFVLKNW